MNACGHFKVPKAFSQSYLSVASMVSIETRFAIVYHNVEAVLPKDLLVEEANKTWLKIRPTSPVILSLVKGGPAKKTDSLTSNSAIQDMVQARNAKAWSSHAPSQEDLFEDQPEPKAKRQKISTPMVVTIDVGGTSVETLLVGQRPSRSDLLVPLEAKQIDAVLTAIQDSGAKPKAAK